jgi:hypothetical protein
MRVTGYGLRVAGYKKGVGAPDTLTPDPCTSIIAINKMTIFPLPSVLSPFPFSFLILLTYRDKEYTNLALKSLTAIRIPE